MRFMVSLTCSPHTANNEAVYGQRQLYVHVPMPPAGLWQSTRLTAIDKNPKVQRCNVTRSILNPIRDTAPADMPCGLSHLFVALVIHLLGVQVLQPPAPCHLGEQQVALLQAHHPDRGEDTAGAEM
jgi:hypothetical protein